MFSASWKAPVLTTDSPMKHTHTWSPPRYLIAKPMPVASGTCAPTIPCPPRKFALRSKMCIEPPLPRAAPVTRPNSSAMTFRAGIPRASAWP